LLQISRLPSPKNFSNFYQLNCWMCLKKQTVHTLTFLLN
jgi:hypothetical protein